MLAQELHQQRARLDLAGSGLAVDGHGNVDGHESVSLEIVNNGAYARAAGL
jgi:hypothetical protein